MQQPHSNSQPKPIGFGFIHAAITEAAREQAEWAAVFAQARALAAAGGL